MARKALAVAGPAVPTAARRADAERNRLRILIAAREALAETGTDVSMAEVARRAGVGMATLYRNFASRHELLEALYAAEVDEVCVAAATATGSPGDALTGWLARFAVFHRSKHPIAAELLRHTDTSDPVFGSSRNRVLAAGEPLLLAAQAAGEARAGLGIDQVLDLVLAASTVRGDPAYVEPILQAALAGLRP
jgi:AcrR family transcriptional regulator